MGEDDEIDWDNDPTPLRSTPPAHVMKTPAGSRASDPPPEEEAEREPTPTLGVMAAPDRHLRSALWVAVAAFVAAAVFFALAGDESNDLPASEPVVISPPTIGQGVDDDRRLAGDEPQAAAGRDLPVEEPRPPVDARAQTSESMTAALRRVGSALPPETGITIEGPAGASVLAGERVLGSLPMALSHPMLEASVTVQIELDGYVDRSVDISLTGGALEVQMEREAERSSRRERRQRRERPV